MGCVGRFPMQEGLKACGCGGRVPKAFRTGAAVCDERLDQAKYEAFLRAEQEARLAHARRTHRRDVIAFIAIPLLLLLAYLLNAM